MNRSVRRQSFYIKLVHVLSRIVREIQRETEEWNRFLKPIEGKILVLCAALREKGKCDFFFFLLKTHKEDKLGVFSRTIIWVLQSQRIEVFRVEDLATNFVVRLYLFLEILLYFSNLLWTQVLGITWVL